MVVVDAMDAPTQVTVKTSMSYALMLYAPVTATATLICRWGWGAAARRAGRQAGRQRWGS